MHLLDYEEISHLPDYAFDERVKLLRKVHCDLNGLAQHKDDSKQSKSKSRCKKKMCAKKKKKNCLSAALSRGCFSSPNTYDVSPVLRIELVHSLVNDFNVIRNEEFKST